MNGQTYNTTQNGLRVAGDNCTADQVLNLTVTPKPSDVVTSITICSDETYTWAVNGQTYNTTQNGLRIAGDNCTADQVLNLTVTPKPADAVTSITICSDETYTWAVNGQAYNTTQNGLRIAGDNCTADQVLNLTVTPKPSDAVTSITICSDETYTWAVNGQTYNTTQSCLLYTSPSPRDLSTSRMPSSA